MPMESIVGALITAASSIVAVVITCIATSKSTQAKMETAQAVTDTRLADLTREVREHNNFARRMPVVEEQIKVINHRLEDLERKVE